MPSGNSASSFKKKVDLYILIYINMCFWFPSSSEQKPKRHLILCKLHHLLNSLVMADRSSASELLPGGSAARALVLFGSPTQTTV